MDEPEKTPAEQAVEHAVDVLVYAPIGLLFEGASLLPQLVERGKSQVTMARMIGHFAVEQGRGEATKAVGRIQDQAAGVLDFLGDSLTSVPSDPLLAPVVRTDRSSSAPATKAASTTRSAAATAAGTRRPAGGATAPTPVTRLVDVGGLAIPDYDSLSASHVVNRLAGLAAEELEAVRLYELANRGRKTILSKVQQLQSR